MWTTIITFCFLLFGLLIVKAQNGKEEYNKGYVAFEAKNYSEAMNWFKKSAEKGNSDAMFSVGYIYYAEKDFINSFAWYKKAADRGYANAMYNLSLSYMDGLGVSQNETEALKWMQKAVKSGFEPAKTKAIAWTEFYFVQAKYFIETGRSSEAYYYFKNAAELEYVPAMQELGVLYYTGNGVPQNYPEAISWYKKAAEKGNPEAMYKLGLIYFVGKVVTQNNTEAYNWFKKAAEKGHEKAKKVLEEYWRNDK